MCEESCLYFNWVDQQYSLPQNVDIDQWCNAIAFFNAGTATVLVDACPIPPGFTKFIGGNRLELIKGRHSIAFIPGALLTQICVVTQKLYVAPFPKCLQS
jgi:hypothetical protein